MTFSRDLRRLAQRVALPLALAAALLVACGGGTTQVERFVPARLIVLGDESSMIEDFVDAAGIHDGFKYGINDRSSAASNKCSALPNFVQSVATFYRFAFAQCNPNVITPQAFNLAMRLAKVDDPTTGLAQQLTAVPDLGHRDMVTMMIGSNDMIELYERTLIGLSRADAVAEAHRRAIVAADQVNAMLRTGARALVFTIPDLGLSPYAHTANMIDPGASALLSTLTVEFNAYLRTRIDSNAYDGRNYGLVLADDIVAAMSRTPNSFLTAPSVANLAACKMASDLSADAVDTAVLACDITTLVDGASASSHLWASDRHIGPGAQSRIGAQAQSRAGTNPF